MQSSGILKNKWGTCIDDPEDCVVVEHHEVVDGQLEESGLIGYMNGEAQGGAADGLAHQEGEVVRLGYFEAVDAEGGCGGSECAAEGEGPGEGGRGGEVDYQLRPTIHSHLC
jgi:hypothetical protein